MQVKVCEALCDAAGNLLPVIVPLHAGVVLLDCFSHIATLSQRHLRVSLAMLEEYNTQWLCCKTAK